MARLQLHVTWQEFSRLIKADGSRVGPGLREDVLRELLAPREVERVINARPFAQVVPHKEPPGTRLTEENGAPVGT